MAKSGIRNTKTLLHGFKGYVMCVCACESVCDYGNNTREN